jgi:hypothetical protein
VSSRASEVENRTGDFKTSIHQPRESSDNPILNDFCRVALTVRLSVFAMLAACVFFFARVFKVRTCAGVHARRLEFLAIK